MFIFRSCSAGPPSMYMYRSGTDGQGTQGALVFLVIKAKQPVLLIDSLDFSSLLLIYCSVLSAYTCIMPMIYLLKRINSTKQGKYYFEETIFMNNRTYLMK